MSNVFSKPSTILLLVLPGFAVMLFAILAPIIISLYFSLVSWDGFGELRFVGLKNFSQVIRDPVVWRSISNFLVLLAVTVLIQNPLAFMVAALLHNQSEKVSHIFRSIYFIPAILTVVLVTTLWVNLLDANYGLINKLLVRIGLANLTTSWLSNPRTALGSVVFIIVWYGFPWALLFYYSGLTTVPKQLEEAGIVDGANRFQKYFHIVIPSMLPVIQSVIIIDVISCLKQMEVVFLSTGGAPGNRTQLLANYLYQQAFKYSQYGYGNAVSVIFMIFALSLTLIIRRLFQKKTQEVY